MPKAERILLQVRLSATDRQRIKSLAARQGLSLQDAVVEAFDAWAEKLRASRRAPGPTSALHPNLKSGPSPGREWVKRALQLDWTKCPEVELVGDGAHELWLLRATDAPLTEVLRAVADGIPVPDVAETFDLDPPHLAKVLEFAGAAHLFNALN
jgi:hypothetical protein